MSVKVTNFTKSNLTFANFIEETLNTLITEFKELSLANEEGYPALFNKELFNTPSEITSDEFYLALVTKSATRALFNRNPRGNNLIKIKFAYSTCNISCNNSLIIARIEKILKEFDKKTKGQYQFEIIPEYVGTYIHD